MGRTARTTSPEVLRSGSVAGLRLSATPRAPSTRRSRMLGDAISCRAHRTLALLGVGFGAGSRSPLPSRQSGHGSHRRRCARSFSGAHLRSRVQQQPRPGERDRTRRPYLPIVLPSGSLRACPAKRRVLPVRIRTLWGRLWEVPDVVRSPNAECPLCGAGVVVEPNAYGGVTLGCGSVLSPRPRQELIAACAKHRRSPYNDKTVKYNAQAATATGGALDG